MKKSEIKVGGLYLAKVGGTITTVRVDKISEHCGVSHRTMTHYEVTNLKTGRKTTFHSAAKFRGPAPSPKADPLDAAHAAFDAAVTRNIEVAPPNDGEPNIGVNDSGRMVSDLPEEDKQCSDPTSSTALAIRDSTPPSSPGGAAAPLAALTAAIAGARSRRAVGSPVAGMVPNAEQEDILEAAVDPSLKVLVIAAGAGTGKTATLKMLEQVLSGRGQYTAFNSSLVAESKSKFVKAACNTTHSLAFRAVGKRYQHRLGGERMRSWQIAKILGITDFTVTLKGQGPPDEKGIPTDRVKTLKAEFLAGQALVAIRRFCQSADPVITKEHLRYIDGIDTPVEYQDEGGECHTRRGIGNNERVQNYILPLIRKAWEDLTRVDGQLPFSHDVYVKLWQLGTGDDRPIIAADYILLDEYQDTAPVFLDVLMQQRHSLLILVGDDNQRIYEWRGAVNAGDAFPDAPRRMLSQSYRFGQAIADVANTVLATLDDPTDLVMRGNPDLPSRVAVVEEPRCYLFRTNAGAVGRIMGAIQEGKHPHLIGGGTEVVAWCQAAVDLQAKRGTQHPELACFSTWDEVVEYSKTDEGSDLRLMVKLCEEFGAAAIRDALKDMPSEEDADMVCSTAHKSKGREWDTVKLGADFPTANKMGDADRRLLYVAATRAKMTLDVSECPPFCGGKDGPFEDSEWIPGLKITYTQPMPSEEDQVEWLAAKEDECLSQNRTTSAHAGTSGATTTTNGALAPCATAPSSTPTATSAPTTVKPNAPTNGGTTGSNGADNGNGVQRFTWCQFGGKWHVRGPANTEVGKQVEVFRINGSSSKVTIRKVVQQYNDAWIYSV